MAYVVDQQDDWSVGEQPVRSFIAPRHRNPFSGIGFHGNGEVEDDEPDDEQYTSEESDASVQDEQTDSDQEQDAISAEELEDAKTNGQPQNCLPPPLRHHPCLRSTLSINTS